MKKQEWRKTKTIYYSDIYNDDFDETVLSRPSVPQDYEYIRKSKLLLFFNAVLYYGLAKPILSIGCVFNGVRIKNRKKLKELRKSKTGVFLYGNHVAIMDAFKIQAFVIHRRVNIIGYSDSLAISHLVTFLVRAFGYLPLPEPTDFNNMRKLEEAVKHSVIDKRQHILIYPEAHIWPYYTKIRDFKSGSFHYPAKLNVPIMPFVTVWRKVWYRKKPCQTIIFGDLIYPKAEYDLHQNRDYLKEECLKQMNQLSSNYKQYEYIKYVYKEKIDDSLK